MVDTRAFGRKLFLEKSEEIVVCQLREGGSMRKIPDRRVLNKRFHVYEGEESGSTNGEQMVN